MRRIIRRTLVQGRNLGAREPFLYRACEAVVERYCEVYPELKNNEGLVRRVLQSEEVRFLETLEHGLAMLESEIAAYRGQEGAVLPGEFVFRLYDTYGFPPELTRYLAAQKEIGVDWEGFETAMEGQRRMARAAWKGTEEAGWGREGSDPFGELGKTAGQTEFVGHHAEEAEAEEAARACGP